MPQKEMGIVPDSPLAQLLAKLDRPDRRLLLAVVQMAPGPRRKRAERELRKRFVAQGIK